MEQVVLLGLILALALGLLSLTLLARLPRPASPAATAQLPITLLFYNLWVAGFLGAAILDKQSPRASVSPTPPPIDLSALILLALALSWLYAHIAQLQTFVSATPPSQSRYARRAIAGFVITMVAGWLVSLISGRAVILQYVAAVASMAILPAAFLASVIFTAHAQRLSDAAWRARCSRLGVAYVILFGGLTLLVLTWGRIARISPALPVALDVGLELLYNVVAIAWLLWVRDASGERAADRMSAMPAPPDVATRLAGHGITKREAEIIALICLGKTNQEIADELFISLTTVKDHNYVAFQKLGVRNRTELTRLVLSGPPVQPK